MADSKTNLDASDLYHSALETLMNSLQINSTPSKSSSCCNNSFQRHFHSANESRFFSFCSTIKQYSKNKNGQNTNKMEQNVDVNKTPQKNLKDTPKRAVTTTRKLKLFETEVLTPPPTTTRRSSSEKELSPPNLLLKKPITQLECMQRKQQERTTLNKKAMCRRTSLRV